MGEKNPYSAAGPHYGHMVQETLMFKYLLEADDDDIVSLEYYDDIAVKKPSGDISAVQSKSALSWNPVSNRSKDLWKTFSNWINMSQQGLLVPGRTRFVMALAKEKSGTLSTMLKGAQSEEQFDDVLAAINEEFKKDVPESISEYLITFFESDRDLVKKIVFNFDIELYDDPRTHILAILQKQEEKRNIDGIFNMMTGWIKNRIESSILKGEPPYIEGRDFRAQLFASRRELSQLQFLHDYAHNPNAEEAGGHFTRTYVKTVRASVM